MGTKGRIRILLADDRKIMRDGLALLFESQPDMEMLDGVEVGENTARLARELEPDVIVIDFNMSATDGISLCRHIMTENPDVRIVALPARLHLYVLEQAIRAGISGFVLTECGFDELAQAVRTVCQNGTYMCSRTRDVIAGSYWNQSQVGSQPECSALTDRDYEIVRLLSLGMTSKEIALRLGLSPKTVDADRRAIMNKLKIGSMAELVKHAIRVGIASV